MLKKTIMSQILNSYTIGFQRPYEVGHTEDNIQKDDDCLFQKGTSKNMDKLCSYFYNNETYPEFYIGIAKRVAICKCPITGEEEWFNGERNLNVENPKTGEKITVEMQIKTRKYYRDFEFQGWVKEPVHEWRMKKGTVLMLHQKFIDELLPQDKRYLKMNT